MAILGTQFENGHFGDAIVGDATLEWPFGRGRHFGMSFVVRGWVYIFLEEDFVIFHTSFQRAMSLPGRVSPKERKSIDRQRLVDPAEQSESALCGEA